MLDQSQPQAAVMVDLVWVHEKKRVFAAPQTEVAYARDYQVFPLYDTRGGYEKHKNVRMLIYAGITYGNRYLTEDGDLWSPVWTSMASNPNIRLGGNGCGCREVDFYMNPPGVHPGFSHGRQAAVTVHPMRLRTFDKMLQRAEECELYHRSVVPVLYGATTSKTANSIRVWSPDKGFINVIKTPIPVCLTPYTDFVFDLPSTIRKEFRVIWHLCITRWLIANKVDTLYIGHDFEGTAAPPDDKIDRLWTPEELENDPTDVRLVQYSDLDKDNIFRPMDKHLSGVMRQFLDGKISDTSDSKLYGHIEL